MFVVRFVGLRDSASGIHDHADRVIAGRERADGGVIPIHVSLRIERASDGAGGI